MNAHKLTLATLATTLTALALAATPALAFREYFVGGSFGEPCSAEPCGDGQFHRPSGIAVDESSEPLTDPEAGDVYVIDAFDARVERFDASGVYLGQFDGSATPAGAFSFPYYESPQAIAVDNSDSQMDPSTGDVYVADVEHGAIDRFSATGQYEAQITGACAAPGLCPGKAKPFGRVLGIAVDGAGNLWVSHEIEVSEFSDTGAFIQSFPTTQALEPGLAVDSKDDIYTVVGGGNHVYKFEAGTKVTQFGARANALAVDSINGEVFLDDGSQIEQFAASNKPEPPALRITPGISESYGIAANGKRDVLYVSQSEADDVEIFDSIVLPSVTTEVASTISEIGATLRGTVDPEGETLSECYFEYGTETSYGQTVPCAPTPAQISGQTEPVGVSAKVSGLQRDATYHFRLVAADANGSNSGRDKTLFTSTPPMLEGESVASDGSTEATVHASIDAEGLSSTYRVEYGTSAAYGSSTPEVGIGASTTAAASLVRLAGLLPGTEYHFRFVVRNALGSTAGEDESFITSAAALASSSTLPDGRAYELVSSATDNQTVSNLQTGEESQSDEGATAPFRAATDGNSVTYAGYPSLEGGSGAEGDGQSNEYLATRSATGWTASDIMPPGTDANSEYQYFSNDLSLGVLRADDSSIQASPSSAHCKYPLYSYAGKEYHALITQAKTPGKCGFPKSAGASADGSHILLESEAALTAQAPEGSESRTYNLYDLADGQLHLVNVLPDGQPEATPSASFGSPPLGDNTIADFSNVVSPDGSRVFWSSLTFTHHGSEPAYDPKALYMRENDTQPQSPLGPGDECLASVDACTVQIDAAEAKCVAEARCKSGEGLFWTASADGSKVFFTDCNRLTADSTAVPGSGCIHEDQREELKAEGEDLYEYEIGTGRLTDLTVDDNAGDSLGADVQGVIGASEDGSYVYFVANGVLASTANAEGMTPTSGQPNLYVRHESATRFIATLASSDNEVPSYYGNWASRGDWRLPLGNRLAEVTPDGGAVVFESTLRLTKYDNQGPNGNPLREVFVYDARHERISCASCNPSGASPSLAVSETSSDLPISSQSTAGYMQRWISDDGSRVFFQTDQPLVPEDTNGKEDVYEWERNGTGSCAAVAAGEREEGCVYLLSGGQTNDSSFLADASASGDDVFFTSRGQLTPQAGDQNVAMYDARVGGGFPEITTACTGTGCQGVPPAPPIFATPSSATYNGVGNFEPAATKTVKKRTTKTTKCRRGFAKQHGRCARRRARKPKKPNVHSTKGSKR
jgi:hypothetical protein